MKRLIKISILVISLLSGLNVNGQDPYFSQFYSNPLYLGPSFAGAVEGSRLNANYRNQWTALPASFVTYSFSYDHYFAHFFSGVGLIALKDAAGSGALGTTMVGLQYSFNIKASNFLHIRPGMQFSYIENGVDFNKLTFIDQLMSDLGNGPVVTPPIREKARDIDFSTSLLVYSKKFWIGGTVDHLLKPNISLYADTMAIPMRYTAYFGYELIRRGRLINPIDETMTFALMYRHQNEQSQLDLGVYWHKNPLVFGIWYRGIPLVNSHRGDALVFLIGYKTEQFNIGYSYDFTISNLITNVRGSHEVSMSFKFLLPKRKKREGVPCPEF